MKHSFYWGFALILVLFFIGFGLYVGITHIASGEPVLGIGVTICALGCIPWVCVLWKRARL